MRHAEDERFLAGMKAGDAKLFGVEFPSSNINWCDDESINSRMTYTLIETPFTPQSTAARRRRPHVFQEKIRVGYLSSDFFASHATLVLFRGVLELHDPDLSEVTFFCHTDPDHAATDTGWRALQPSLVSVRDMTDAQAAETIRAAGIDILIDLKGHTKGGRGGILNAGAAPIQVAYIGYPGSGCGIDYDYIIGDRFVLPDSSKPYYHEKFCRMPESYQANDDFYRPDPPPLPRSALGLPADRFVFASFNAARKISHRTARLWARIMRQVPDSVLWILCLGNLARDNFSNWMVDQGISRDRIIMTGGLDYGRHIARLKAADFGLETYPVNGHTTSSDKLWAGLPIATFKGRHFASRVSESLLNAIGLPEMVAEDEEAYEALVVALAKDRQRLAALREKLQNNRTTTPLFDTLHFTRHLECAYRMMIDRAKAGLDPDHFDVPPLP
ncbi:hypothetical protein BJF93_03475 [Xaviernesmea oryzae]|uniref:O-GlcNAc transferase C-terminal domain-containing protein n=1 Tax=Xaviernesmea oryzae TaxID=464029 RepID=A0A1Q9AZK2_9HYPH|nr:hypothetical protein [Xaviernesmea oryzae]OLP61120.1 hypothetical protein BJF93_03475 [Xaviernesmea oryzae]SEL12602.1 Glycosyl transferase family 41 [Xaviernesmea oryzae]